jgi:type III secretion system YscD/HrpQ family protein
VSALLKIVQGPNAGAEIALPDGIEITVGKADSCDIVLADPTLPDAPMALSATPDGVLLDGAPLEPLHVVVHGSTAFATGPADAAWGKLVWPKPEEPEEPENTPARAKEEEKPAAVPPPAEPAAAKPAKPSRLRLLVALALLLLAIFAVLAIFAARRHATRTRQREAAAEAKRAARTPAAFAERYGLVFDESAPRPAFSGNFATRAERLAATADLYSAFPGAALDLTDDESLKSAVSDALFALGGNAISVDSVADRVAVLSGTADSPAALSAALDAIRADVPRLADVDTGAVKLATPASPLAPAAASGGETTAAARRRAARAAANAQPSLPVCGILDTPYPCLVLQNGSRVFPGATLGGFVVVSIAPDSVVLTNANGSFTWKP